LPENQFALASLLQVRQKIIFSLLYYSKLPEKLICPCFITASSLKKYFFLAALLQTPQKNNLPLLHYCKVIRKPICPCCIKANQPI